MSKINHFSAGGRIVVLRWDVPFEQEWPVPEQVAANARAAGARFFLLDATRALYADSDALRWLLRFQSALSEAEIVLRVAAYPGGPVWRNLLSLQAGLDLHETVRAAWKRPWLGDGNSAAASAAGKPSGPKPPPPPVVRSARRATGRAGRA